jgi:cytochrome c-type biogenesis protein
VLSYAAAHAATPARGAFLLGVYAAGLSLPLLLCALGAGHASAWIRRASRALPKLEKLTGVALAAIGLWTLAGAFAHTPAATGGQPQSCAIDGHTCALPSAVSHAGPHIELPAKGATFLEFTSDECPVCRRMHPVIERLAATCHELDAGRVRVDVTTSDGRALADRHHVRGTPTFVLLDEHGVERARLLGENSREQLAEAVEKAFGVSCWS